VQNYLKNCKNLVQFVVRISQNYFPRVVKAYEEELARNTNQEQQEKQSSKKRAPHTTTTNGEEGEDEEWPHQTRNKVIYTYL
jgi:hypothetical protein